MVFHLHPAGQELAPSPSLLGMGLSCSKVAGHAESSTSASKFSLGVKPCWFHVGRAQNEAPLCTRRFGLSALWRRGTVRAWGEVVAPVCRDGWLGSNGSWRCTAGENAGLCYSKNKMQVFVSLFLLKRGGAGQHQLLHPHCSVPG